MARSDWQVYAAQALREGRTLREASRSWHDANRRVFNNPSSPESRYHHHRRKAVGELLKRNVSFSEARRLVDRGFDGYQRVGHQVERGIVHAGERRNPDGGTNWLLIGGIAALAWWLAQRQATPTASSNGPGPWLAAGAPPGTMLTGTPMTPYMVQSIGQSGQVVTADRALPGPGGVFGASGTY